MIKKTNVANPIETINDFISLGRNKKVLHLITEDRYYNGRNIIINGLKHLHFGSCSYLGLELDNRLKESAKHYIDKYGVQFSSSRGYLSSSPYSEYEELLSTIFKAPIVTYTSTSLGHHAVIPVIIEPGDAIILDQQVHASVQDPCRKVMLNGVHVEPIRHNRIDLLEERIKKIYNTYDKIWYMVDGVYSMYGDFAPVEALTKLLNKYPKLWIYADDAHGMSIAGNNGAGVVYGTGPLHPKLILATSLNKAFASGGGVFVFPNEEMAEKVKNCSGAYIFSGGHQIAVIGTGIAAAKIHLSNEIYQLQDELRNKLIYCHRLLEEMDLPVLSVPESPINYIGVGLVNTTIEMVKKLHKDGLYINAGMFPAVPDQSAGLRFTITLHHTKKDIEYLVDRIAYHYPRTFQELGRSQQDIIRGFRKVREFNKIIEGVPERIIKSDEFEIQHETTIHNISKKLWDNTLGTIGANNWDQLAFFEDSFQNNIEKENNWKFHYYLVRDKHGKVVIATFFTEALTKDDMFAPTEISKHLEKERKENNDPYYLSSKTLTMGCLLSVGSHMYLNKDRKDWRNALSLLFELVQQYREKHKIPVLSLRDFYAEDIELKEFFIDLGLKRVTIPDGHTVNFTPWESNEGYLNQLTGSSSKSTRERKSYVKKRALEMEERYEIKFVNTYSRDKADELKQLYMNVSDKSFEIVGFTLHHKFFKNIIEHPNWEVLELWLKPEYDTRKKRKPVGMALSYVSKNWYSFLATGIDYNFLVTHNVYPQILWQMVKRANQLKLNLNMGITASQPKRKFGAQVIKNVIYVQNKDTFKDTLVGLMPNHGIKKVSV